MGKKFKGTMTLKVPWGHIAAKTWGNPENTHILVVHGTLDNAGSFDRLIQQLPDNFYYVCIDLPGHGLSSHFPSGMVLSYLSFVLAIRLVLDELKWSQTYYMGHSFGAALGTLFSIIYPDRIKKLIVIDSVMPPVIYDEEIISRIKHEHDLAMEQSESLNPRLYTREEVIYALSYLRLCCLTNEAAEALFERAVTKINDLYYYNRDVRQKIPVIPFFNTDQSLYLAEHMKVETLIILASSTLEHTLPFKKEVRSILENNKSLTIVDVQGNHDVHNNYPERISGHISQFLNSIHSKL